VDKKCTATTIATTIATTTHSNSLKKMHSCYQQSPNGFKDEIRGLKLHTLTSSTETELPRQF
jgi:hypothetical protein